MEPSFDRDTLAALLAEQRALEEQVRGLRLGAAEILQVGQALLAFARHEDEAFSAVAPLLDPVVQLDLAVEHRQFEEDLQLLEWLVKTTPESPDVAVLTVSLRARMRHHVGRDGRLLARAAGLSPRH